MTLQFQKATQASSYLRLALLGGPGAGKTWTSLALASGLGARIALIDTERGSARAYARDFDFDVCALESFHPRQYMAAMAAACEGGYDVLVIDSLSHAWAGQDGALELVDRASAANKASRQSAWQQVTPLHHRLVHTMLRLPLHLIVTLRTRVAYVTQTDEHGQHVPRKVALAPVQCEGCEYDFDVIGELHRTVLTISKTRWRFLHGLVLKPDPQDPITPGRQLGRRIAGDLGGEPEVPAAPPQVSVPAQQVEPAALKQLWSQINRHGVDHEAFRAYLARLNVESTKALSPAQLEQCLREIEARKDQAFQPTDATGGGASATRIRAQLLRMLARLQTEITQAEQNQPPGEPHAQALIDLAQWLPRVARAGENPETPPAQLQAYLVEIEQALSELEQMALTDAAV